MNIEIIKTQFPFFQNNPEIVYLDSSATSQKPKSVIDSISDFYENHNSNIHRGIYKTALESTSMFDVAREVVAAHFGAESNQLIFTRNSTESLNLVAHSISHLIDENSEIVTTILEHHSNFLPWFNLSKKTGAKLVVAQKLDDEMRLNINDLLEKITERTKIVAITHASNVTGEILNLEKVVKKAKEVGAFLVVDGAQSAPHLEINFNSMNIDFFTFSGHKMLGPTGSGGVLVSEKSKRMMNEFMIGGGTIKSVSLENVEFADFPEKFEAGTPNIAGQIGLKEAVNFLQKSRMKSVELYEKNLTDYFLEKISTMKSIKLFGPSYSENRLGVFSFKMSGISAEDTAIFLNDNNIAIRSGHHCAQPLIHHFGEKSVVRASFYLYNSKNDIDRFVNLLTQLSK